MSKDLASKHLESNFVNILSSILLNFIDLLSVFLVPFCSVEIHIGGAKGPPDRVCFPLPCFYSYGSHAELC